MKRMRKERSRGLRESVSNSGILTVDGDHVKELLDDMKGMHGSWKWVSATIRGVYDDLEAEGIVPADVAAKALKKVTALHGVIDSTESFLARLSEHIND